MLTKLRPGLSTSCLGYSRASDGLLRAGSVRCGAGGSLLAVRDRSK